MSDELHTLTSPAAESFDRTRVGKLNQILSITALVGLLASLIGLIFFRQQFAYSWLFSFTFFFTLCAGALFWILVHHATDAEWSVVVRRQLENVASLLPVMALFFLPVLICAPILFKWWTIPVGVDHVLDHKRPYLNIPFFVFRAILYFVVLGGAAFFLRKYSVEQDSDGAPRHTLQMRKIAAGGIFGFALALTFGAFDWLMGLDYKWFSTMWGVYIFAGAAGASMSMLVLIVTALRRTGHLRGVVTMEHYHIMGKLMLAFTVFWAYIGFSQYMLIWYANLPEETSFFIRRNTGSWNLWTHFLVIFRFFVPFALLLMQGFKKNPNILCGIAGWILFMQAVDIYLIVMPMLHKGGFSPSLLDLFTFAGIGATLALLFIRVLGQTNLFPLRDPRLPESLRLTN